MTRSKVRSFESRVIFKSHLFHFFSLVAQKKAPRQRGTATMVTNPGDDKRDDLLQKSDMKNEKFEAYYRKQLAVNDDEWPAFLDICREPLPSTFRICGSRECVYRFLRLIELRYPPSGRQLCSPPWWRKPTSHILLVSYLKINPFPRLWPFHGEHKHQLTQAEATCSR